MQRFSVDYDSLSNAIYKKTYRLADVEHRLVKVAFDIVKFRDDDTSNLWQIQSADDGEYIIALYNEGVENVKSASSWDVVLNKVSSDLNFYYKGEPVFKMASRNLGIPLEEMSTVEKYLPKKLASDKNLVNVLLKQLSESAKKELLRKYPELA